MSKPILDDLPVPKLSQIQFCSPLVYATEEMGYAVVDVMRIGDISEGAAVQWETRDGAAKAGKKYVASSGVLEFAPNARYEQIKVHLIDNEGWDPTVDFVVALKQEGIQNATVHRSQMTSRVKIIDDDVFPTNKFKTQILSHKADDVSPGALMIEYIKMNWRNPVVRRGSWKCLAMDFALNIKYIFEVGLRIYLINDIFMPVLEKREKFDTAGMMKLAIISGLLLVPDLFMHFLAYRRNYWKVAGASRLCLQANLARKYMSYTASSRKSVGIGEMILVAFADIPELVAQGYATLFPLVKNMSQLIIILLFQLLSPVILGEKTLPFGAAMNLGLFVAFPVVLWIGLKARSKKSARLMTTLKQSKNVSTSYTIDMLENFYLLADYSKRAKAIHGFEDTIRAFNGATSEYNAALTNNRFIPEASSMIVNAAWMFGGGIMLMSTDYINLGTFLANLGIFTQMGSCWSAIYENLLDMEGCAVPLKQITTLLNLPTEDPILKEFINDCNRQSRELIQDMPKNNGSKNPEVDNLPIQFYKLSHSFGNRIVFSSISLVFTQGKLHAVRGARGSGTSTLLQLAGRRILPQSDCSGGGPDPDKGNLFIPLHLMILHISKEPLFMYGSLYENLTYGVAEGNADGRLERVVAVCQHLGLPEHTLTQISDQPGAHSEQWSDVLSSSSKHLLNMARGFICNPEVLVFHKPSMGLGPKTRPIVFKALRLFVDERGLELNINNYYFRRPRTCIFSAVSEDDFEYADEVHIPFGQQPDRSSLSLRQSSLSL